MECRFTIGVVYQRWLQDCVSASACHSIVHVHCITIYNTCICEEIVDVLLHYETLLKLG